MQIIRRAHRNTLILDNLLPFDWQWTNIHLYSPKHGRQVNKQKNKIKLTQSETRCVTDSWCKALLANVIHNILLTAQYLRRKVNVRNLTQV